jgi:F420-0:gamma-glutamyl ligase
MNRPATGMHVIALHSKPLLPPKDDLYARLDESLASLGRPMPERAVVAVSSKVVAIGEGRCVLIPEGASEEERKECKHALARSEADLYLQPDPASPHGRAFTVTHGAFVGVANAGIDESNGNGYFILWPKDPMRSAEEIRAHLRKRHAVEELGVIITDSTSVPMRNGVMGVTIGYSGFRAQYDYRGKPDIFGRLLKFERLNVADSLATAATLAMGEGNGCTPFVLIEDIPNITFAETESDDPLLALSVSMENDLFAPFFKNASWRKKKRT